PPGHRHLHSFPTRRSSDLAVPQDNSGNSGNSFASFMLGQVYSGGFTIPNTEMLRIPYHAFFAQDDWKLTPRLTMNIGLRYEIDIDRKSTRLNSSHVKISYA